jgi:hypothetical protein
MKKISHSGFYSIIFISFCCNSIYATERSPSCSIKDINDIKNIASIIVKEALVSGKCIAFNEKENTDRVSYYQYIFSSSSSFYSCRLAKSAFIVTDDLTAANSAPLLKCVSGEPLADKEKWDNYFKEYNKYVEKTNDLKSNWKNLLQIALDPLPKHNESDHFKAAIYTTYNYTKNTTGKLPPGVEVWFTQVDEMLNTCNKIPDRKSLTKDQLSLRFSQLLGLPPDAPSDPQHKFAFISIPNIQVSGNVEYRKDNNAFNGLKGPGVFRPCASIDYNTEDNICSPIDNVPLNESKLKDEIQKDDKVSSNELLEKDLSKWAAYQFYKRYDIKDGWPQYPWTGRGYTYDWNSDRRDHYGLSEYVMSQNTEYYVYNTKSIEEFIKDCRDL